MMRGVTILVAALSLSAVAQAAAPPAKALAAAKPAPMTLVPGVRRITLSPEGRAIATRIMSTPDARVAEIQAEINTIRQEKLQMISGTTLDVDKLEPIMRREEVLQSEYRTRQNDKLVSLLRALSDTDRIALLQNLANPAKPQSSAPAAPGR